MTYGARPYGNRAYGDSTSLAIPVVTGPTTITSADTGAFTESERVTVYSSDSGSFSETNSLHATVTSTDSGSLTDAQTVANAALQAGVAYLYENVGISPITPAMADFPYTYENATTDAPQPHIWYITPTAVNLGDTVTIIGMGFGDDQAAYLGSALLNEEFLVPFLWFDVPAGTDAYDSVRSIHPSLDSADPEHQRIQFVVPHDAHSGDVVVVLNS